MRGILLLLLLGVVSARAEEVRIARFPMFYSGAVSFIYGSLPEDQTESFAKMLMDRERPDPVAVVPASAEQARLLRDTGLETAERDGGQIALRDGSRKIARIHPSDELPLIRPGDALDLQDLHALRVDRLTSGRVRELCERAIAERAWILVLVDAPGPEEAEAVNRLHDFHTQLWNGTPGHLVRYMEQSRHANVEITSMEDGMLRVRYEDRRPNPPPGPIPLSLQFHPAGDWIGASMVQNGKQAWTSVVAGRVRWEMLPGEGDLRREPTP
jgi:hypothetical protein